MLIELLEMKTLMSFTHTDQSIEKILSLLNALVLLSSVLPVYSTTITLLEANVCQRIEWKEEEEEEADAIRSDTTIQKTKIE